MENSLITTKNRRLEQFYYAHGVDFVSCTKDVDGMTTWAYSRTPENENILAEWKVAQARREHKKGA